MKRIYMVVHARAQGDGELLGPIYDYVGGDEHAAWEKYREVVARYPAVELHPRTLGEPSRESLKIEVMWTSSTDLTKIDEGEESVTVDVITFAVE